MAIPPPPYAGISGIYVQIDKHVDDSKTNYDGNARPGQLVVDTSDYSLWVGNSNGILNPITGGGGTSGYSGYSGKSGYSGFSGTNGVSGYSGIDGASGYSGIDGASGYSGIDGASGYSGIDGASGYSGYSGATPAMVLTTSDTSSLQTAANAINTTGKTLGLMVFNTTDNLIYVAGGSAASDFWYPSDGGGSINPT